MKYIFLILSILFALNLSAQTDINDNENESRQFNRQFGLNAFFINSLLPLDNDIGNSHPYLFHFMTFREGNKFHRKSLNIDLDIESGKTESEPTVNQNFVNIDYKAGWGKHRELRKKLRGYYGFDLVPGFDWRRTTIKDDEENPINPNINSNSKRTQIGGHLGMGPMLGIQYQFTERFGVYTEATFYMVLRYSEEKFEPEDPLLDEFTDYSFNLNTSYRLPTSLIIFYTF